MTIDDVLRETDAIETASRNETYPLRRPLVPDRQLKVYRVVRVRLAGDPRSRPHNLHCGLTNDNRYDVWIDPPTPGGRTERINLRQRAEAAAALARYEMIDQG